MESSVSVSRTEHETIIQVKGRFTAKSHNQFRDAYRKELTEEDHYRRIVVDLAGTEYIDSSALGMLLLMRAYMRSETDVEIIHARPEVLKVLKIANFERMFKII